MAPMLVLGTLPDKSFVLVITVGILLVNVPALLLHSKAPQRVSVPVSNQIVAFAGAPVGRPALEVSSAKSMSALVT